MKQLETLYRVYDIPNKEYYSTGTKSIWKSKAWAIAVVQNSNRRKLDFEIHTIKQVVTYTESANELIQQAKELKQASDHIKKEIEEIENNLYIDFYKLPIDRIKELYQTNKLSDSVMLEVKVNLDRLAELNKMLNDLKKNNS